MTAVNAELANSSKVNAGVVKKLTAAEAKADVFKGNLERTVKLLQSSKAKVDTALEEKSDLEEKLQASENAKVASELDLAKAKEVQQVSAPLP